MLHSAEKRLLRYSSVQTRVEKYLENLESAFRSAPLRLDKTLSLRKTPGNCRVLSTQKVEQDLSVNG